MVNIVGFLDSNNIENETALTLTVVNGFGSQAYSMAGINFSPAFREVNYHDDIKYIISEKKFKECLKEGQRCLTLNGLKSLGHISSILPTFNICHHEIKILWI